MCFYNEDYDWIASVHEETEETLVVAEKCGECGLEIPSGSWARRIYQQEEGECQRCEMEELLEDEEPCEEHDYGETFLMHRCRLCDDCLNAIEAVEEREGCPPDERRPALCNMVDALRDMASYDGDNIQKYDVEIANRFPHALRHFRERILTR